MELTETNEAIYEVYYNKYCTAENLFGVRKNIFKTLIVLIQILRLA